MPDEARLSRARFAAEDRHAAHVRFQRLDELRLPRREIIAVVQREILVLGQELPHGRHPLRVHAAFRDREDAETSLVLPPLWPPAILCSQRRVFLAGAIRRRRPDGESTPLNELSLEKNEQFSAELEDGFCHPQADSRWSAEIVQRGMHKRRLVILHHPFHVPIPGRGNLVPLLVADLLERMAEHPQRALVQGNPKLRFVTHACVHEWTVVGLTCGVRTGFVDNVLTTFWLAIQSNKTSTLYRCLQISTITAVPFISTGLDVGFLTRHFTRSAQVTSMT